jgi:AraC family transcriptional regulator
MSEIDVRIVRLEPQRVAASYGFGAGPEGIAWEKMLAFVKEQGLNTDGESHRYFGFNNPNPAPGSPNYGYEQWITVGPEVQPAGEIKIKDFGGGLYAVTHCQLSSITDVWMRLAAWREKSPYRYGQHQWLEEVISDPIKNEINGDAEFDLYMPIIG